MQKDVDDQEHIEAVACYCEGLIEIVEKTIKGIRRLENEHPELASKLRLEETTKNLENPINFSRSEKNEIRVAGLP